MASLADLFNPTFLMFLGILVLVVAMVVVYFESKMREQNHKINSMLSLVSTLAEDVGGLKMGFHQIATTAASVSQYGGEQPVYETKRSNYLEEKRDTKLITVSDDESESDSESESDNESVNIDANNIEDDAESVNSVDDEYEIDSVDDLSMNDLSDDTNEEENLEQIKVFKINVDVENVEYVEDVEDVEDLEDTDSVNVEDVEEKPLEQEVISASELKTISINLEEPVEKIDYKKLQLPKLKSVVVEKGLATSTEASKLKKGELLKLLGIE
jgi:hypothetical protein